MASRVVAFFLALFDDNVSNSVKNFCALDTSLSPAVIRYFTWCIVVLQNMMPVAPYVC
jgi:hypothetical protein